MTTTLKVLLYVALAVYGYCEEHDVPVMMYIKRGVFLANWKLASAMQNQALKSYRSYREEVEIYHG